MPFFIMFSTRLYSVHLEEFYYLFFLCKCIFSVNLCPLNQYSFTKTPYFWLHYKIQNLYNFYLLSHFIDTFLLAGSVAVILITFKLCIACCFKKLQC